MIKKKNNFGVFEAKYLWKFLSISGKTYMSLESSRHGEFLKKKNGDHVICTLMKNITITVFFFTLQKALLFRQVKIILFHHQFF